MTPLLQYVVAGMGAMSMVCAGHTLHRHITDTRRRINRDLAELNDQPIDYWPVGYFDDWESIIDRDAWAPHIREGRAVWPAQAGAPE